LITLADGQWFADANIRMQRLGTIAGTVTDEHGEPVVNAFVRVLARITIAGRTQVAAGQTTRTDDRGVFLLPDLAPGRYIVQVPSVQQSFPASMTAAEFAGISPDQLAQGRPVPEPPPALVANGGSRLIVGAYLPPVAVNGRAYAYAPVFYPHSSGLGGAATIDLKAGEARSGVDFSLSPVAVSSISGVVSGPSDALPGLLVRLLPEGLEDLGAGSEIATATLDATGRFTLFNVPAGSYVIDVKRTLSELQYRTPLTTPPAPLPPVPGAFGGGGGGSILAGPSGATYSTRTGRGNAAYFTRARVTVGEASQTALNLTLQRGGAIRGRFVTAPGVPASVCKQGASISAEPADGNLGHGLLFGTCVTPETFEISGLLSGEYLLRFLGVSQSVESVIADGEDHAFKAFDASTGRDFDAVVTLTDKKIDLSGSVADAHHAPVKNAVVIVFPVERDQWANYGLSPARMKGSPATSSGTYRFQSLPAGEYYVVGVPPDQADIWKDPAKLPILAGVAARVTLAWGDVKTQDVTVVRIQ
jgi:hypothetical protein